MTDLPWSSIALPIHDEHWANEPSPVQKAHLARITQLWHEFRPLDPRHPDYEELILKIRAEVDAYVTSTPRTQQ